MKTARCSMLNELVFKGQNAIGAKGEDFHRALRIEQFLFFMESRHYT
jgi:hypothetical protein